MHHNAISIATAAVILLSTAATFGQSQSGPAGVIPFGVRAYHHASTFEQGYLNGLSNLVGAQAQAAYYRSLAMQNLQLARRQSIANRTAYVHNYFLRKEINRAYRRREQLTLPVQYGLARPQQQPSVAGNRVVEEPPTRPTSVETKAIDWPEACLDKRLDSQREYLERILSVHRPQHGLSKSAWKQIRRIAVGMRRQLDAYPEVDQAEADRWLRRLIMRPQILVDG